ncbi:hypothetical protein CHLRE_13g583450v5 [Chlamydomonas reinhardtii]|uniref:Early zygote protein n=2 Tax=Chlamydomonas reinhardtii TaxID=3055 RepID=Q9M5D4_CHLRE|nr:uncharacterized protein CHLRE_13g583450v5 [Chlamydomonas reinhardtii]AAF60168.1 early zygote protein [Chlamydomonas reinhardtii]PNW74054.1 hypothetical protein CHLRE_13g583450v5 [Chlamydomonas reinhardtii]BAF46290.1 zygote specific classVIII protein [Chlamydomonas reinhardtii]|eukprot:XP_001693596.1 predicted protein [Chlamydomonas reinhardtii]
MGIQQEDGAAESRVLLAGARSSEHSEQWSTGIFDCFAQPGGAALGCVSLFMPCVQYGVVAETVNHEDVPCGGQFGLAAGTFFCLEVLAGLAQASLWPGISLVPTSGVLHYRLRRHLRDKYRIQGSWQRDLCATWWCGPCALAQETREIAIRSAATAAANAANAAPAGKGASMQAPGTMAVVGNLLLPAHYAPAPVNAATVAAAAVPDAAMPVTGVPVATVPPVAVATVTLRHNPAAVAEPK